MISDAATKATADHLRRDAYLYVRQSSLYQVTNNTESSRRQYDLRGRAVALGWPPERVIVIDVDQGQSGASAADREGFQRLVADVSLGKAGIVLGLECSRLARNNADWHRLLQLCALTNTLICDEDGLYDPGSINDRLLLGLKGTISEAELHFIRARLQGGILAKAARGELSLRLPVGLVYDAAGTVVLDPDAGVRQAITHLFATFEATGSASAVVKAFAAEGLTFPARHLTGSHAGELYWVTLRHDQALFVLHNPRYAGAYFYGRRRRVTGVDGRHRSLVKPRDEWTTFIPGAHVGYISLAQFEANQATLAANAAARGEERRAGPAREGPALLQGLVVCGRCGRRMTVGYHRRCDRSVVPDYACQREGIATGTPPCQRVCGPGVDEAVAALVLDALSPLALKTALAVSAELAARAADADRIRAAGVERARYAADAARRRYLAVDPANRLVAGTLEADWNHKLRELADAQDDYERARQAGAAPLDEAQQARIRALASDLPALWADPATPMRERKRLIRLLVTDVTLIKTDDNITARVRLPGGITHTLTVPRPLRAWEAHTTPAATVAVIDELLADHTYDEAAKILNDRGLTGGWGKPFNVASLTALCRARNIPDLGPMPVT
jgi:DNA invertase Pin-like site-specific DNA recombinase